MPHPMLRLAALSALLMVGLVTACGGETDPSTEAEIDDRFGEVTTTYVEETVEFTDQPYDFTGPTSIADMLSILDPDDFVSYVFDRDYAVPGACDRRGNDVEVSSQLPLEIEGIVTLHPRYFYKATFCDEDERYYGSYFIQDASGGVMVLKDSRISDFMIGDRVRIKVRGLYKYFDIAAVVLTEPEQIIEVDQPVYYEEITRTLSTDDVGKTLRVTGKVSGVPTSTNFNEMCLVGVDDMSDEECGKACRVSNASDDCESDTCVPDFNGASTGRCERDGGYWLVSLDREIGQRQPRILEQGDVVTVTGPVINSFGLKFLTAQWGQIQLQE